MSFKQIAHEVHLKKWTILNKTTDYTITLSDLEKCIIMNASTDKIFTLPDTSISYKGRRIRIATIGSGRTAIKPHTGGTIQNTDMLVSDVPYSFVELVLTAANTWEVFAPGGYQKSESYGGWKALGGNGYNYCRKITIDHNKVMDASDLSNFPFLFKELDQTYLKTTGNGGKITDSNGYDIIFTSDITGDTKLDHEIVAYDGTNGHFKAWVRIPTLKTGSDTEIFLYYNNSSISSSQENKTGVWNSNYKGVWHLNESGNGTADEFKDSTSNANDGQGGGGTVAECPTQSTSGYFENAQDFDGANDHIANFDNPSMSASLTVSAWVKHETVPASVQRYVTIIDMVFLRHDGGNSQGQLDCAIYSGDVSYHLRANDQIEENVWYYVVCTWDGTTQRLYKNGKLLGAEYPSVTIDASTGLHISSASETMNGLIDEVRLSNIARSAGWNETEYNNYSSTSTFYGVELWQ